MDRIKIEAPIQLLVEGNDDRNFFEALRDHLALSGMQIQTFHGVDRLRRFLLTLVDTPGFQDTVASIGIVRDAEDDAASAFQSVRSSLERAGLPAPSAPGERAGDKPPVTVLILPDGARPGMLETLLCETFQGSPLDGCIDDFFTCVGGLPDDWEPSDKARAQAFLATKERPQVSVGVAAARGYWNLEHGALGSVRAFLEAL